MTSISEIRPSPIAGTWYSANPKLLAQQMDDFIQKATAVRITGEVFGLVAPHAGHRYSGSTAGIAYRTILGKSFPLVVILSPSHHYFPAELISSAHQAYTTPLGNIPIHQEAMGTLQQELRNKGAGLKLVAEDEEHSIEIQLPFLQRALKGDFSILPVMMLSQDERTVKQLSTALEKVYRQFKPLVIASSDLSHFKPLKIADELDRHMLEQIAAFSPEGVLSAERNGSGSACGYGPIATTLMLAKTVGAKGVQVLQHTTSAEITGDFTSVVGYGSAVLYFDKS